MAPLLTSRILDMSAFSQLFIGKKPGTLKVWGDWPIRLFSYHLNDMLEAIRQSNNTDLRIEINGTKLSDSLVFRDSRYSQHLFDELAHDPRFRTIRSIAFIGNVTVHLGPKSIYAYAAVDSASNRSALFQIREVLVDAKRRPGTIALRTWGAAITTSAAFIAAALLFQPDTSSRTISVLLVGAAGLIYLFAAFYAGALRRVIIRARNEANSGFWKRNSDGLAVATMAAIIGGLVTTSIVALAGVLGR